MVPKKPKWNELPCPECKEPVASDAARCPHCQAVYSAEQIEARKNLHKSSQKWSFGCLAIVGILVVGTCATMGDEEEAAEFSSSSGSANEIPEAGSASATVTTAMTEFNDSIMAAVSGCDAAGEALAEASEGLTTGATSIYEAYSLASGVEDACRESWNRVSDIDVPSEFEGRARDAAEEALETCENAMIAKQMAGAAMKEVFDGDMRPSRMEDAQQKAEVAQAGTLACVAAIFDTASKAGVELGNFSE